MPPGIVRWGGWAGVVAAVLFALAGILLILIAPPQRGSFNSFSDYLRARFKTPVWAACSPASNTQTGNTR